MEEKASRSKAPCRTLLNHYSGEEKASRRAVPREHSLEKTTSKRLLYQYGGKENAPGKS